MSRKTDWEAVVQRVSQEQRRSMLLGLSDLALIPPQSCTCGKPVVFPQGSKTFDCTRCGQKWRVVVKVEPYGKTGQK